ncbi:Gfo/Idh/MocA family protein [Ascidiimonas sp. W6]|uniref:Gfo/Idh/MocA family protein n=1 Tax=Ascidiimonas meishanensis TaxID=3128903 RepID=UPI0030EB5F98
MKRTSLQKTITAIAIGAGDRANVYGDYAIAHPKELRIIGVAEPNAIRNERFATKHKIEEKNRFSSWEEVFKRSKFADAVIIATSDTLHYEPCMAAMTLGYDVLIEKPISPSEEECREILALAEKKQCIVGVCHVLRYAPYFQKLKEIVDSKLIGDLVSIQHMESIEHAHMAHSYVRGNWHNSKESSPIILGKSCHDLDIMRWLVGSPCSEVAAFGNRKWFRKENAPEGSTNRCTDGCPVESECPYSALKIYQRDKKHNYVFDFPDDESKRDEYLIEQLQTTDYGRCVYRMDNDQPDHYVASLKFENDVTAAFSMEAFTSYHGRRTRLMGTMGDIVGDMETFEHTDFRTGKTTKWEQGESEFDYHDHGHGGGDWRLVQNWVQAVSNHDASLLTSTIKASIESHIIGFKAEKSRLGGKIEKIDL